MNVCTWIPAVVTLADGSKIADDSPEWRAECEARRILGMGHTERIEALAVIEQRRGASGLAALLGTIESVEPAYVLDLPNKAQRNGYLRSVELHQGENASTHLRNRCMELHGKRENACGAAAA
jgi:hypothetical protein